MAKLYIDHQHVVRFDSTRDNRLSREAAIPKAALLIAAATERHARMAITAAVNRGQGFDAHLEALAYARDVRRAVAAC